MSILRMNRDAFEVMAVTPDNGAALFDLLEEQARTLEPQSHTSEIDAPTRARLIDDICHRGTCNAFLVYDRQIGAPVTAVTYYDCWVGDRRGLYLEDIVTAAAHRGQGHGTFALASLAQIALAHGFDAIRWECAASNDRAQRFYDGLGGERMTGSQTYHCANPAALPLWVAPDLLRREAEALTRRPVDIYRANDPRGEGDELACHFFRSYSTFRAAPGLHLEAMRTQGHPTAHACLSTLVRLGRLYAGQWNAHYDVTLGPDSPPELPALMGRHGFAPLSYDGDRMIPRQLRGAALHQLAQSIRPARPAAADRWASARPDASAAQRYVM